MTIDASKISKIPEKIERDVTEIINKYLKDEEFVRCRAGGSRFDELNESISDMISKHSNSSLIQYILGLKTITSIINSNSVMDVLIHCRDLHEDVSFIFYDGAITLSFNYNELENDQELMVIAWGVFKDKIIEISNILGLSPY